MDKKEETKDKKDTQKEDKKEEEVKEEKFDPYLGKLEIIFNSCILLEHLR